MIRAFLPRLIGTAAFFTLILVIGIAGYMVIEGWSLRDAAYMTVISVTMVGYQEVHPLSPTGQYFTMGLLALGLTGLGVWFALITSFVVEMDFLTTFQRRRMLREVEQLSNHIIVCGAGRTGLRLLAELEPAREDVVVIERNPSRVAQIRDEHAGVPVVEGDATQDNDLEAAGIARARGLMACLGNDRDNLFVCLSAKTLNPEIKVVVRAYDEESTEKLYRAGADHVVSPNVTGAIRMASVMLRPSVVSFLDVATRSRTMSLRMEQATVGSGSILDGRSLREALVRRETGLMVIAVRKASGDGEFVFNPAAELRLDHGDEVIVLGEPEQIERLREQSGG